MKRTAAGLLLTAILSYAAWSYFNEGIVRMLIEPDITANVRLDSIRRYFEQWGAAGPLAYVFIVTVEVILAPIPGSVLYLPGGVIFGWPTGGAASLAGNVIGAGLACQLMRTLGRDYLAPYLEGGALKKYETVIEKQGLWIVFLLRVNPLTSSDLVSYAAGMTRLAAWKVMAGTMLGMAPLCFAQAYFAQEIFAAFPSLIYPLILLGLVYAAYVARIVRQLAVSGAAKRVPEANIASPQSVKKPIG
jgi:uncharacterized membrane protein YdjX (TVP38/TMEM64 family)